MGVMLLAALAATLLTKDRWAASSVVVLAAPFLYAVVWGPRLRVVLAGRAAADETVREVLRELPKSAQIGSSENRCALIRFPVDPAAAIVLYHDVRVDWRGHAYEVQVQSESPWRGQLSRTLLLRRADAWRTVVAGFASRGYAPGR